MTTEDRRFLIELLARDSRDPISPSDARWERILFELLDEAEQKQQAQTRGADLEDFLLTRVAQLEEALRQAQLSRSRSKAKALAGRRRLQRRAQIRGFLAGMTLGLLGLPLLARLLS